MFSGKVIGEKPNKLFVLLKIPVNHFKLDPIQKLINNYFLIQLDNIETLRNHFTQ